jgi:hypothetical protein
MCRRDHEIPREYCPILPLREMRTPAAVRRYAEKFATCNINWICWLQEHQGTLLARTFAVKRTRKEGLQIFECMREVPGCGLFLQRNMWLTCMSGWQAWFPAPNEIMDCEWRSVDVRKRPGVFMQIINPEAVKECFTFQYCGWDPASDIELLDYLHLWIENPGVEYFAKLGLKPKAMLVKKATKDGNFRKWLRSLTPKEIKDINRCGPTAAIEAYKTHKEIYRCDLELSNARKLRNEIRRYAKPVLEAGWSAEKVRDYLIGTRKNEGKKVPSYIIPDLAPYADYISAVVFLHLDIHDTKVAFPYEFRRMHDLRILQMNSMKAAEDRKAKKEMVERFRDRAKDLKRFEKTADAFCIIIPTNPDDLKKEGTALHHCVGVMGYDLKMANGRSFIAFLRQADKKTVPFVTIEYNLESKRLQQCYGKNDSRPLPAAQRFAEEWAANVTKRLNAEEARKRKKAEEEALKQLMDPLNPIYKDGEEPRREATA